MTSPVVRLGSTDEASGVSESSRPAELAERVRGAGSVSSVLELAAGLGAQIPLPGSGKTAQRWEALATVAAEDLTAARVLEPHLDAVAILREADKPTPTGTWGVFASEGPAATLALQPDGTLTGTKPWCSLAGSLTHALVTASTPDGRALFALDLRDPGVRVADVDWIARGLHDVPSGPIELTSVPARAVGKPGWYLERPGFWWGGIGVAACWYGGAVGLARSAWTQVARRPNDLANAQLGRIDIALHAGRCALLDAARLVDDPSTPPDVFPLLAQRVRALVAAAAEDVLRETAHLLGPAPLAFDEDHARRVVDLQLYVRQHHADRDLAGIGATLAAGEMPY